MPSDVFVASVLEDHLRQGEILSDCVQYIYNPAEKTVVGKRHQFCIIASQDCDLERDWTDRSKDLASSINSILLFPASDSGDRPNIVGNSTLWMPAKRNSSERFQVLEACPVDEDRKGSGVPALIIDFRRFFSVTPEQFYYQFQSGAAERRAVLRPPYREHFQNRAVNYLARVALDRAHDVQ